MSRIVFASWCTCTENHYSTGQVRLYPLVYLKTCIPTFTHWRCWRQYIEVYIQTATGNGLKRTTHGGYNWALAWKSRWNSISLPWAVSPTLTIVTEAKVSSIQRKREAWFPHLPQRPSHPMSHCPPKGLSNPLEVEFLKARGRGLLSEEEGREAPRPPAQGKVGRQLMIGSAVLLRVGDLAHLSSLHLKPGRVSQKPAAPCHQRELWALLELCNSPRLQLDSQGHKISQGWEVTANYVPLWILHPERPPLCPQMLCLCSLFICPPKSFRCSWHVFLPQLCTPVDPCCTHCSRSLTCYVPSPFVHTMSGWRKGKLELGPIHTFPSETGLKAVLLLGFAFSPGVQPGEKQSSFKSAKITSRCLGLQSYTLFKLQVSSTATHFPPNQLVYELWFQLASIVSNMQKYSLYHFRLFWHLRLEDRQSGLTLPSPIQPRPFILHCCHLRAVYGPRRNFRICKTITNALCKKRALYIQK